MRELSSPTRGQTHAPSLEARKLGVLTIGLPGSPKLLLNILQDFGSNHYKINCKLNTNQIILIYSLK